MSFQWNIFFLTFLTALYWLSIYYQPKGRIISVDEALGRHKKG